MDIGSLAWGGASPELELWIQGYHSEMLQAQLRDFLSEGLFKKFLSKLLVVIQGVISGHALKLIQVALLLFHVERKKIEKAVACCLVIELFHDFCLVW